MRVKWKRALGIVLAFVLVVSAGVYSSDHFLKATDGDENIVESSESDENQLTGEEVFELPDQDEEVVSIGQGVFESDLPNEEDAESVLLKADSESEASEDAEESGEAEEPEESEADAEEAEEPEKSEADAEEANPEEEEVADAEIQSQSGNEKAADKPEAEVADSDTEETTEEEPEETVEEEEPEEEEPEETVEEEEPEETEVVTEGISGNSTIKEGKTTTLTGTKSRAAEWNGFKEKWTSDDEKIATVTYEGNQAVVTGVSAGTTIINHSYITKRPGDGTNTYYTESTYVTVTEYYPNHFKLDKKESANVVLYVTTSDGQGLTKMVPGDEFATKSADTYFYVQVPLGYTPGTSFQHTFAYGDDTRTSFPTWDGVSSSIYEKITASGTVTPGQEEAVKKECTYKFQYTGKTGSRSDFWALFSIEASPLDVTIDYDAGGVTSNPQDDNIYHHKNVVGTDEMIKILAPDKNSVPANKEFDAWVASDGTVYHADDMVSVSDIWGKLDDEGCLKLTAKWIDVTLPTIVIKGFDESITYDGLTHKGIRFTVDGSEGTTFTYQGETYSIEGLSASSDLAVNAGTYPISVSLEGAKIYKGTEDVTDHFNLEAENGTLTIEKREVTLTSTSVTQAYTGEPLTAPSVEVGGKGFVTGEGVEEYIFSDSAKVTEPNTSAKNEFTYSLTDNTLEDNYAITVTYGELSLTGAVQTAKYEIEAEANSGTFVYDGTEHTVSGFKTSGKYKINGETYTLSGLEVKEVTAKDYRKGGYAVTITGEPVVTDENGNDVTSLFIIHKKSGKLEIQKRPIMLTSQTAQKEYDGTALTAKSVTDTYNAAGKSDQAGFVGGDGASYTFTGSQILVGTSENYFKYTLNQGTNADNYQISTTNGTLNVQNVGTADKPLYTITLRPVNGEAIYNGTEQRVEGFEQTTFEFDGQTYVVSGINSIAKGTLPGVYSGTYSGTAVVTDSSGNDVTDQFIIDTSVIGTLTIRGVYTLTINYVDAAGNTLAPSHVAYFAEGTVFEPVITPEVSGYRPNFASVSCPENGMPDRDITVNVVYTLLQTTTDNGTSDITTFDLPNGTDDTSGNETLIEKIDQVLDETNTDQETDLGDFLNDETDNGGIPNGGTDNGGTPNGGTDNGGTPNNGNNNGGNQNNGNNNNNNNNGGTNVDLIPVLSVADEDNDETTIINDEDTPKGVITFDEDGNAEIVTIDDEQTALASGAEAAAWALINLLAAIVTAAFGIVLLVTGFLKKKNEDDKEKQQNVAENRSSDGNEAEEENSRKKRSIEFRCGSILAAVVSVILFCVTENMNNPMVYTDRWTIWMLILLVLELAFVYAVHKNENKDKQEQEEKEQ
jgi:hypothetical protein